jgi:hypothetical protein
MSSKLYPTLATVVIALAGAVAMTSALAVEATQFAPQAGVKARADVKADKARTGVVQYGEATVFADQPATQARALARTSADETGVQVVRFGDATQFVDQPGSRSRADVRAETLAALRSARRQ